MLLQTINGVGQIIEKLYKPVPALEADQLIDLAQKQTELSDFGEHEFQSGLKTLIHAYNHESQFNTMGRVMVREMALGNLANLLRVEDTRKRMPEIEAEQIKRPIFVLGLPRTGSTFLHRLLAQHPQARALHYFESTDMGGVPTPDSLKNDPRVEKIVKTNKFLEKHITHNLKHIHAIEPTKPEECMIWMQNTFRMPLIFNVMAHIPSYNAWLDEQDLTPTYRYLKFLLQMLQFHFEGVHWVLKCPAHLGSLQSLLDVFPDAVLIQTHRHPIETMPSWCSLSMHFRLITTRNLDLQALGQEWQAYWVKQLQKAEKVRQTLPADRILDVYYSDLIRDPVETFKKVYQHAGYTFLDQTEENVEDWLAQNKKHKHGKHHYSLEQFGFSKQEIETQFASYLQSYY